MKQKNFLKIALVFFTLLYFDNAYTQLSIDAGATNYTINFDSTLSGVNNGTFNGSGFNTSPTAGQLDGDAWKITGLSEGDQNFGDTNTSGDFVRGTSSGGETTGGLYAFEVATSNYALGFQPGGSDFTPGTIVFKLTNNTGASITSIDVSYKIWVYNDQGRASTLNFSHSNDDSAYTGVDVLDFTSTETADGSPTWTSSDKTTTISGLSIAAGASYYVRWSSDDSSGSGSRDEISIDDIVLNATTGAANPTVGFDSDTSSVSETDSDQTVMIPVTMINHDGSQVDLSVTPSGTADGADYILNTTSLTFNTDGTQNISLTIKDDADQINETVVLTIAETTSTGVVISSAIHTVSISDDDLPNIIINEIFADPATTVPEGDANGDGFRANASDDEFIEIVNLESTTVNIGGYTLSDGTTERHTFTDPTNLAAGGSIVIFGGGTPTSISGLSVTASSGTLSLANGGETVTLKNSGGSTVTTYTYGGEGGDNQSIARSPDLTGVFVQQSTISSNPVNFSPGRYNTTGEPFSTNTWTGATDNDWSTASNWSLGTLPTASDDVQIIKATNQPTTSGAVSVNSVTIASGATLIATNTFTGSVTYNRALENGSQWYLMSSPVIGETYDNTWVTDNSIPSSTLDIDNRGVGWYDNSSSDTDTDGANTSDSATGFWRYMESGSSSSFVVGRGYSIISSGSGSITFAGTGIYTSNQTFSLEQGVNNFNLIGNPFAAYLTLGTFHTTNTANIGTDFYFWNGSSYDTRTSGLNPTFEIAPGQGFFVEASSTNNVTFEISDASHQGTETFQKTPNTRPEITLSITENSNSRYAKVFYIDGTTKGYDLGYDGKLFGGVSHSFAIYSELLESDGKKYQLQSLPNTDYENMVIPIGVIASAGKEITFSAETINIPNGLKVYLEDRLINTFSILDEFNNSYKITLTENLNGTGRFYLHTKSEALSTDDSTLQGISVFAINNTKLRIAGIYSDKANIKMYSILGKKITENTFSSQGNTEIDLPNLNRGIYIVQITTEKGEVNKKIILE